MSRIVWVLFLALTACATATVEQSLERVNAGMDKDEVLRTAGSPRRTFREHGQDHWIYVYFKGDVEMNRIVVFEDGKVAKLGRPRTKAVWEKELEAAKKDPDSGFKSIDGGKDD